MSATTAGLAQVAVLVVALAAVYVPFGNYLAAVFSDGRHWRVERAIYRLVRVDPDSEQRWPVYAAGVLGVSFAGVVLLYLLQRLQPLLPLSFGRGAVHRAWRSTPRSRSSRIPTGSPMCPRRPWATPCRWLV